MVVRLEGLADLRAWWGVLRPALLMRPHPCARPGADEAATDAYLLKVVTLIGAAAWIFGRVHDAVFARILDPLRRFRDHLRQQGLVEPIPFGWLDLGWSGPGPAPGLKAVIEPWAMIEIFQAAALLAAVLLAARLLRPRLPVRPALALGLAALASATLYNLILGVVLFRVEDALGIGAALDASLDAAGVPQPGFEAALARAMLAFPILFLLTWLEPLALVLCLKRGFVAARHPPLRAWCASLLAFGLATTAGMLAKHGALGDALVRMLSF